MKQKPATTDPASTSRRLARYLSKHNIEVKGQPLSVQLKALRSLKKEMARGEEQLIRKGNFVYSPQ